MYMYIHLIWIIKEQIKGRDMELSWVKGHAFIKSNEVADDIALKEMQKLKMYLVYEENN